MVMMIVTLFVGANDIAFFVLQVLDRNPTLAEARYGPKGMTALHFAAQKNDEKLITQLLRRSKEHSPRDFRY